LTLRDFAAAQVNRSRRSSLALLFCLFACSNTTNSGAFGPASGGAPTNTGGNAAGNAGGPSASGGIDAAGGATPGGGGGSHASGGDEGAGGSARGGTGSGGETPTGGTSSGEEGGHGGGAGITGTGGAAVAGTAGAGGGPPQASGSVRIYWVDTEGGAATVIAAPDGRTIVVDGGFQSRDAQRVAAILTDELDTTRIDAMIATHYHIDHIGGIPALATMFTIGEYLDHGMAIESGTYINDYMSLFSAAGSSAKRTIVKPGDRLDFAALELTFVTSAREVIDPPLPTAVMNEDCADAISKTAVAGEENPMSVGFLARFGNFDFVSLGDLTWNAEQALVCPVNRIGPIDLYQVSHHGGDLSSSPQLVNSLAPLVAVMNNGAAKGGSASTFDVLRAAPGFQDLWSLHRVTANDDAHNAEEALTANPGGQDQAFGISAVIEADGTFTVTNQRTGSSRTYASR
jgi:beta-lactamase superfamily II metal-dependent hydrolase